MNLCIIICTKNRPVELEATLQSIFFQTILPDKIVIIDDGNYVDTERVLDKFPREFITHYNHEGQGTGLTQTRNYAITKIPEGTDIVLFLDNDVSLDSEYIDGIKNAFETQPDIAGASGFIRAVYFVRPWYEKIILGVFGLIIPSRVPASFWYPYVRGSSNLYPLFIRKGVESVPAEWLSGCNMAYRKSIFEKGYRFDERLTGYCLREDMFFSNRLYQDGYKLQIVYKSQLIHLQRGFFSQTKEDKL